MQDGATVLFHRVTERFWFLPSCSSAIPSGIFMVRAEWSKIHPSQKGDDGTNEAHPLF